MTTAKKKITVEMRLIEFADMMKTIVEQQLPLYRGKWLSPVHRQAIKIAFLTSIDTIVGNAAEDGATKVGTARKLIRLVQDATEELLAPIYYDTVKIAVETLSDSARVRIGESTEIVNSRPPKDFDLAYPSPKKSRGFQERTIFQQHESPEIERAQDNAARRLLNLSPVGISLRGDKPAKKTGESLDTKKLVITPDSQVSHLLQRESAYA